MADDLYIEPVGDEDYDDDDLWPTPNQNVGRQQFHHSNVEQTPSTTTAPVNRSMSATGDGETVPYIRMINPLKNLTKDAGDTLRLRCAVEGTEPIDFRWYKNDAPLIKEKSRISVRNQLYVSRLIIKSLEPLDQAYYRCDASNKGGQVQSTSRVEVIANKYRKQPSRTDHANDDEMTEEKQESILIPFTCQKYIFDACQNYLSGQKIYISSRNLEDIRDIDRKLRAAIQEINGLTNVSDECKRYAAKAACFHSYQICDSSVSSDDDYRSGINEPKFRKICKHECEILEQEVCRTEYEIARAQNLVGKEKDHILPNCADLPSNVDTCLRVLDGSGGRIGNDNSVVINGNDRRPIDATAFEKDNDLLCYTGNGKSYRGMISQTKSGQRCERWSDVAKKNPRYAPSIFPELKANNFCRNPDGTRSAPWCVSELGAEYCDVPKCQGKLAGVEDGNPNAGPNSISTSGSNVVPTSGTNRGSNGGDASDGLILGIAPQYLLLAAGVLGVTLLAVLVGLACYCFRSRRHRIGKTKKNNNNAAPATPLNTAVMNGYHYHYHGGGGGGLVGNGMRKPVANGQQVELSQLLAPSSGYVTSPPPPVMDGPREVSASNIQFGKILGVGQFGMVWQAELIDYGDTDDGENVRVAVKSLKEDAQMRQRQDFEHEVALMSRLKHPNILQLIGVSCVRKNSSSSISSPGSNVTSSPPLGPCMIFEYIINGDLNEFLQLRCPYKHQDPVDSDRLLVDHGDFLHIATQIAAGMEYLASHHYIHRDLATRNCLVADRLTIKISDFGMARDIYASDYYRQQSKQLLPIRWMPQEAIVYGRFSEASDVWSYGVTLWEIYSYGLKPYNGHSNNEVVEMIQQGCLLPCPTNCPPRVYTLMAECWQQAPNRRPRFAELHARLQNWSMVSSPAPSSVQQSRNCGSGHSGHSSTGHSATPGPVLPPPPQQSQVRGQQQQLPTGLSPRMARAPLTAATNTINGYPPLRTKSYGCGSDLETASTTS